MAHERAKRILQLLTLVCLSAYATPAGADPMTCEEWFIGAENYAMQQCVNSGQVLQSTDCTCTEVPGYGITSAHCTYTCMY